MPIYNYNKVFSHENFWDKFTFFIVYYKSFNGKVRLYRIIGACAYMSVIIFSVFRKKITKSAYISACAYMQGIRVKDVKRNSKSKNYIHCTG